MFGAEISQTDDHIFELKVPTLFFLLDKCVLPSREPYIIVPISDGFMVLIQSRDACFDMK